MKIVIQILILLLSAPTIFGQLDYGPRAVNKESAVKMHYALRLLRGDLTKPQEDFLRRGIRDRRSISETEAKELFSMNDLRDIFFYIGREDISVFKSIFEKEPVAEKKAIWMGLTLDQKNDVRRTNYAWGIGYLNLNDVQIDYLAKFSKALPTITKAQIKEFELEAISLFPGDEGKQLFGSIGPYTPCKAKSVVFIPELQQPGNCNCNMTSSFNTCSGTCGPSVCRTMPEGCGFGWLQPCASICIYE